MEESEIRITFDITKHFKQLATQGVPHSELSIQEPITRHMGAMDLFNKFSEDILLMIMKTCQVLKQSKDQYFSNSAYSVKSFSREQREEFDEEIKTTLNTIKKRINELSELLEQKSNINASPLEKEHFKGIVACLYLRAKYPNHQFKRFLEFNQALKTKLSAMLQFKTTLKEHKSGQSKNGPKKLHDIMNRQSAPVPHQQIEREEQRRNSVIPELEEESKLMLLRNASKKEQIMETQQTITEIIKLLDETSNTALQQQLLSSTFLEIGELGLSNINKANKNLVEANTHSKQAAKYWIWYFNVLTIIVLLLDFIKR